MSSPLISIGVPPKTSRVSTSANRDGGPRNSRRTPAPSQRSAPCLANSFTLIEVIMAMGIVTFALLVIFSLMPVGIGVLTDASKQIVQTEIFAIVGAELESTPFIVMIGGKESDGLQAYKDSRFPIYFDVEGLEVPAANAVYTVRVTLANPEFTSAANPFGELRRATISIGFHADPGSPPANGAKPVKRPILLVNRTGKPS